MSDTFTKDKDGVIYKHPERSCINCKRFPCFKGQNMKKNCDYAKYGCIKYIDDEKKI